MKYDVDGKLFSLLRSPFNIEFEPNLGLWLSWEYNADNVEVSI